MIAIEVSPDKYKEALDIIGKSSDKASVSFAEGSETAGHIHTHEIDADFEYRQRSASDGTLVFTNEVKHGMYGFVSDSTIGSHISDMIAKMPASDTVHPQPASLPNGIPAEAAIMNEHLDATKTEAVPESQVQATAEEQKAGQ